MKNLAISDGPNVDGRWGAQAGGDCGEGGVGCAAVPDRGDGAGAGRGQEVYPLADIEPTWCVVAAPAEGVSTPQAFRDWDALCAAEGLTPEASTDKLNELSRAYASAFGGAIPGEAARGGLLRCPSMLGRTWPDPMSPRLSAPGSRAGFRNDFERVVFRQHPSLAEIKRLLAAGGTPEAALYASLSGSGSALFGLYLAREAAEAACEARAECRDVEVRTMLTRTLPREAYWREMLFETESKLTGGSSARETRPRLPEAGGETGRKAGPSLRSG